MSEIEPPHTFEDALAEWEALLEDELSRRRDLGEWHLRLRSRAMALNKQGVVPDDELREWLELADAAYSWHFEDQIRRKR